MRAACSTQLAYLGVLLRLFPLEGMPQVIVEMIMSVLTEFIQTPGSVVRFVTWYSGASGH